MTATRSVFVALVAMSLGACGGGGSGSDTSGSSSPQGTTSQSPGGIWTVQYVEASGANMGDTIDGKALVTETGDLFFAGINTVNGCAVVGFGQLTVNGSAISGTANDAIVTFSPTAGVNTTCTYPDGSTSATSSLSGTIAQRSTLALTDNSTTTGGTALGAETHTWVYSNLYAETPSLANLAGNYTDGADTLTISSNGTVFEQDPTSGCVVNGQISIPDASYNAYAFSFTFSSCMGSAAILNGQTATGLGYLDDSVSPNQVVYGVHLTVAGQTLVLAGALPKN